MSTTPDTQTELARTVLDTLSQVLEVPVADLRARPTLGAHEGWDSLASLELLGQLESRLGTSFDLRSYHAARTVDDLVALAESAR